MSSYSEYLGRLKQRIPNYIDTRPHRDAGHQTEIVKRLAAATVQESLNPAVSGNLMLNAPTTRLITKYNGVRHVVKDTSLYNAYTAGQAVAQGSMPINAKPSQIVATCCTPPEINDRMAADAEYAKIIHAKQGVRADCCSMCGKVYDAAVCGCVNRLPERGGGGGGGGCDDIANTQGMFAELENPPPYENPEDDYAFDLPIAFPFYFYGTDYADTGDVYYSSNHVIGFGPTNTDYEDWDPANRAILVGFTDRDMDNFWMGPGEETLGNLSYFQGVLFGRNDHGDDIPNAVRWRYVFGRDEVAGYQYIEIDFQTVPEIVGEWNLANGSVFVNVFGNFAPAGPCTRILLRSNLNGEAWELLPNQGLNVPLPPPLELTRAARPERRFKRVAK